MSKCNLRIEFDRIDRIYQSGETINGVVHVSVNKPVNCDDLTIERIWKTHGRGNESSGGSEQISLFKGTWLPDKHQYPFSITIPETPITYRGHLINIDWYLEAQVDIPWAIDPKVKTEFIVTRKNAEKSESFIDDVEESMPSSKKSLRNGVRFGLGPIVIVIMFLLYQFKVLEKFGLHLGENTTFYLIGVAVAANIIYAIYKSQKNKLAESALGTVQLQTQSTELSSGEKYEFNLQFTPRSNLLVNGITAELEGRERAVSGSGTRKRTYNHVFYRKRIVLSGRKLFSKSTPFSCADEFTIPNGAPSSLDSYNNDISWVAIVHIDIHRYPDWSKTETLTIV